MVAEDLADASFAGLYESILDVRGEAAVLDAVRQVWASAHAPRVRGYHPDAAGCTSMAVLVQRMVPATAAGVAFTADPVSGARDVSIVSAVRGLGERLVSGHASAEEWRVRGHVVTRIRDDGVLDAETVRAVAALAARVAELAGAPQDIEWALVDGQLALLQARPITALPDELSWAVPWGGWVRNFRFGEWIGVPVTPAFESWLLTGVEDATVAHIEQLTGFTVPRPAHLVVHGWYFFGLNLFDNRRFSRLRLLGQMPRMLWRMVTRFRAIAALPPPIAHLGFDWSVREWREQLLPAYETLVAGAQAAIPDAPIGELASWIDRLAARVGRTFASMMAVAGYAAKAEFPVVQFWSKHLVGVEGSWLELVRSASVAPPSPHDVQGLDWLHPTLGELGLLEHRLDPAVSVQIARERDATMACALAALPRPKLRAKLERLVAEARRAHAIREEQARVLTLAWPALRLAIHRLGEHLTQHGVIGSRDQVFFLERTELLAAIDGDRTPYAALATARNETWQRQRRLSVPLVIGRLSKPFSEIFKQIEHTLHGDAPMRADELRGHPGNPGRVTGRVRILRDPSERARLAPGDILVATVTTPAWTPAFLRAAAVVTDTGSIASHASIVAREYGIPAVVATGDATTRLRDGQLVTVDGSRGVVVMTEPT